MSISAISGAVGKIGMNAISGIIDMWKKNPVDHMRGLKADSLVDYTRAARVEPIVLIDADCLNSESLSEVQQSLLSLFAGYYLQAMALSINVGKISVFRHLDRMNPSRSSVDSGLDTIGYGLESYKDRLPSFNTIDHLALETTPEQARFDLDVDKYNLDVDKFNYQKNKDQAERIENIDENKLKNKQYRMEFEVKYGKQKDEDWNKGIAYDYNKPFEQGFGKDTIATLKELANLSIGKIFNVEITDGQNRATIPVSIRLLANSIPTRSIIKMFSSEMDTPHSAKERYHAWRAGRLEFIRDIVLCQDLIDAHRKELMHDKDGVFTGLLKRNRNNQIAAIASGNPSVATASNMLIISDNTAGEIEQSIYGKLKDFKSRQKMFKQSSLMIIAVINKQWDRITFYTRGINEYTEVSARDLKTANKNDGISVTDVLKAYQLGNGPSL